jgi:phage gp29-like protein
MFNIFNIRRKSAARELARQLTVYDRRNQEYPGTPPGPLPYAVYDQMQRDSMVQTVMSVKKQGVLAARHAVLPASDSTAARRNADFVEENFAHMDGSPATVLSQAMDAFAKGWSVQELVFDLRDGMLMLDAVRSKDPSRFGLELDEFGNVTGLKLESVLSDSTPNAQRSTLGLPIAKFVLYANRGGYARPKGRSDLDAAYPHWKAKTSLLDAWRLHLEKFASPTVLGRYQRGLPAEETAGLLAALDGLAKRNAIVFPNEIEVGTLGGGRESNTNFMDAIEFHNREIARSVLGQTLTTDEGRRVGSLALGKVHLQVFLLQLQALRKELADVVMTEQVIRPLVELNFGPGEVPRFEFEEVPLEAFSTGTI